MAQTTPATELTTYEPAAIAAFDVDRYDEVLKLTGQDSYGSDRSILQQLRINKDPEDDQGRSIPHGTFTCEVEDVGHVYAKTVTFRPFLRGYQYRKYDNDLGETVARTRILRNWSEEPFSTDGTIRCGRPKLAKNQEPTPEQAAVIKAVTCFQIIFGVVTFNDAVNAAGEKVEVRDYPVVMRVRGINYRIMSDLIDNLTRKRKEMIYTNITLGLKREKNGEVVYYTFIPTVDYLAPRVWRGDADLELLKNFNGYLDGVNKKIFDDYKATIMSGVDAADSAKVVDAVVRTVDVAKTLDADFHDDPLPETMGGVAKSGRRANTTVISAG